MDRVRWPGSWALARVGAILLALSVVGGCGADGRADPTAVPAVTAEPTAVSADLGAADAEFGGLIHLEGARLVDPEVGPGDRLGVELVWRLLRRTGHDLRVTGQLVDADGATVARDDRTIGGVGGGTSGWAAGDVRSHLVELQLSDAVPPGRYSLALAVSDPVTGSRIPITADAGFSPVVIAYRHVLGAVSIGRGAQ